VISEWFFSEFLGSLDVKFDVDSLHANLFKEYGYTATNLYVSHDKIVVLNNKLRLSVIGDIAIIVNSTREETSPSLFERSSGNQHELELELIEQNSFEEAKVALDDGSAPSGEYLLLGSVAQSVSLIIATKKRVHIFTLDVHVDKVVVPHKLLVIRKFGLSV
jgi:hypothetical protein